MTREMKELLVKDLCARSPYGLICSIYRVDDLGVGWRDEKLSGYFYNDISWEFYFGETPISIYNDISKIKPYLRPMTSMTEKERVHYNSITYTEDEMHFKGVWCNVVEWLNAHHFDYRGLIDMKLALEAPEGMYNF